MRKLLYTIAETEKTIGRSHTTIYHLISEGKLDAVKDGPSTLVTGESIERYVSNLPKAEIHLKPRKLKQSVAAGE